VAGQVEIHSGSDITSGSVAYTGNVTLNAPVALTAATGASVSFTGVFSDGTAMGSVFKTGDGTVNLAAASTYTGTTTLHQGTLALGVANAISTTSGVTFEGGTLATGGLPQNFTMGPIPALNCAECSSTLDLGVASSATTVRFADSHATPWNPGVALSVNGWTRGTDHLLVGSDATGLSGSQLAEVKFADFAQGASISAVGEVTPQIGDINQNTLVNVSDVAALETALTDKTVYQSQHFSAASNAASDVAFILDANNDGVGNNLDLQAEINLLANAAGPGGGGSITPVPEPASAFLLALGGLIITARRVRAIVSSSLMNPQCSTHRHASIS